MKVLVIGGTLFIGRLLVAELLKAGHEVTVLHRKPKHDFGKRVAESGGGPQRSRSRASGAAIGDRRFEVVFDNVYDWERGTTAAQVEATRAGQSGDRLQRYIFMSSVAAYGDGLNHHEGDPLAPDDHPEPYVRNKAMSERAAVPPASEDRLPRGDVPSAVRLRPGESVLPRGVFLGPAARRPADHHPRRRHAPDAVRSCQGPGARLPARHGGGGSRGRGVQRREPKPLTQVEVVRAMARAAGKKPELVRVPRERIAAAGGNPMGQPDLFRRVSRRAADHRKRQ